MNTGYMSMMSDRTVYMKPSTYRMDRQIIG